jgi:hypothetical protein
MYVVFDSAVLIADYRLRSIHMKALLEQSRNETHTIAIPNLVFDEVVNKWREHAEIMVRSWEKVVDNADRLLLDKLYEAPPDLDLLTNEYSTWLKDQLDAHGIRWLDIPRVTHLELARKAVAKTKPFAPSGAGYRDALIWESVKELASESVGEVIFVSFDKKDFWDGKGNLHADLVASLEESDLKPDQVVLITDIAVAVERLVETVETTKKWFLARLTNDSRYREKVVKAVVDNLDLGLLVTEQYLHGKVVRQVKSMVTPVTGFGKLNTWVIGKDRIGVELEVEAPVEILVDQGSRYVNPPERAEASWLEEDWPSAESCVANGVIFAYLELPRNESDTIYGAYARVASVSDWPSADEAARPPRR